MERRYVPNASGFGGGYTDVDRNGFTAGGQHVSSYDHAKEDRAAQQERERREQEERNRRR